jgi:hypothetical protein
MVFLYPYSKPIKAFKADDIQWEIINQSKSYKEFDPATFTFKKIVYFSDEFQKLDNTHISIKGFIKKETHGDQMNLLFTGTVTEVCFMCNHDEMYSFIELIPNAIESGLYSIKNDTYIEVQGDFRINHNKKQNAFFLLENAVLVKIIPE